MESDYVRKLDEKKTKEETQWYVPRLPVINPHKPEKVRTSLNNRLLTGPGLLQKLMGTISGFREHPISFTADIEVTFLQVKVPLQDCKVLRFLWRNHPDDPISVYE